MAIGPDGADINRLRIGLVVLVMGIVLVLWSWGNWVYRAGVPARVTSLVHSDGPALARDTVVSLLPKLLMYSLLLGVVAFFGGYALFRAFRRYREAAHRERAGPTVELDAWAMHKAPRYDDNQDRIE